MNLETIGFDLYQSTIVLGIKIKALVSTLDENQKESYEKTIKEETEKIKEKLYAGLTKEQADDIIKELSQF